MDEVEQLLNEKKAELAKVVAKLALKEGGIREKLKFKNRLLRKGRDKALANITTQVKLSESKAEREKAAIQAKIAALEAKMTAIDETFESLLEKHYHPLMSSLYESEGEMEPEDLSLPTSYHELNAQRTCLEASVKMFQELVEKNRREAEEAMRLKYEAKLRAQEAQVLREQEALRAQEAPKEPKVKRVLKVAKKALVSQVTQEPQVSQEAPQVSIEFQKFQIEENCRMAQEWRQRQKRIINGKEGLPEASDPFWTTEAKVWMYPAEYKGYGDIYENTKGWREDARLQRQLQREQEEKEALREEEELRARKLERAKMGIGI